MQDSFLASDRLVSLLASGDVGGSGDVGVDHASHALAGVRFDQLIEGAIPGG